MGNPQSPTCTGLSHHPACDTSWHQKSLRAAKHRKHALGSKKFNMTPLFRCTPYYRVSRFPSNQVQDENFDAVPHEVKLNQPLARVGGCLERVQHRRIQNLVCVLSSSSSPSSSCLFILHHEPLPWKKTEISLISINYGNSIRFLNPIIFPLTWSTVGIPQQTNLLLVMAMCHL